VSFAAFPFRVKATRGTETHLLLKQGINENRTIFESLDLAWSLLRLFPREVSSASSSRVGLDLAADAGLARVELVEDLFRDTVQLLPRVWWWCRRRKDVSKQFFSPISVALDPFVLSFVLRTYDVPLAVIPSWSHHSFGGK
jgi:hypothetical protein